MPETPTSAEDALLTDIRSTLCAYDGPLGEIVNALLYVLADAVAQATGYTHCQENVDAITTSLVSAYNHRCDPATHTVIAY